MQFRLRRIEAMQWNQDGDHPEVSLDGKAGQSQEYSSSACCICGNKNFMHGIFHRPEKDFAIPICPGDWIIEKADGTVEKMRPEKFRGMYERIPLGEGL